MVRYRLACAAGVALAAVSMTACVDTDCIPTVTEARDASVADLGTPRQSGVLQATLTAKGKGLESRTIGFSVESADGRKELGSATTSGRGVARLDLKTRPVQAARTIVSGEYSASFGGDGTYCSSSDSAAFTIVSK